MPSKPLKMPLRSIASRRLLTEADLAAGIRALRRKCPHARRMHDVTGSPLLRLRAAGFEGLCRIIVAQQLSVASAAAIWARACRVVVPFDAPTLLATSEADLRVAGLSGSKIRTLRAIATAVTGGLDLETLDRLNDDEIHGKLTQILGVGPWTADIFMMFCLGRADCFAAGDLALQIAAQRLLQLEKRPTAVELLEIAEPWRPWRAVAALLLWAYYKEVRSVKTAVPV